MHSLMISVESRAVVEVDRCRLIGKIKFNMDRRFRNCKKTSVVLWLGYVYDEQGIEHKNKKL